MLCLAGGAIWHYGANEYILFGSLDTVISPGDYYNPGYIARLDTSFNFKWRTVYNAPVAKETYIAKEISDGGVVLVGFKDDSVSGFPLGWIAKMDSSGNKLWEHFYSHSWAFNYFSDFQETFDHGFIICGMSWDTITSNQDSWIVKLDSNGCLDTNCGINTGTVEIADHIEEFAVYPNPANENVTVITNEAKVELTLYDLLGKEVMHFRTEHERQVTLDISFLSNGIYFLQFRTGKKLYSAKVVKE